jgi:hypothetical protein
MPDHEPRRMAHLAPISGERARPKVNLVTDFCRFRVHAKVAVEAVSTDVLVPAPRLNERVLPRKRRLTLSNGGW